MFYLYLRVVSYGVPVNSTSLLLLDRKLRPQQQAHNQHLLRSHWLDDDLALGVDHDGDARELLEEFVEDCLLA